MVKNSLTNVELTIVFRALKFSAYKHRKQRRKGSAGIPYINHPIEVTSMIIELLENPKYDLLAAALLHDTIEDTNTSAEEIEHAFGNRIMRLVMEVTDDKRISRVKRKQLQIDKARELTYEAKCIKIADKACNISDILYTRIKWSRQRKINYVKWANEVIGQIRDTNAELVGAFDKEVTKAQELLDFKL